MRTLAESIMLSFIIDWGDGATTPGNIVLTAGSYLVEGSHTYADESPPGGYPLKQIAGLRRVHLSPAE